MIKLIEYNEKVHGKLHTGPVDDDNPVWIEGLICPNCGEDNVYLIREQSGFCHSGKFATAILRDHYYCADPDGCDTIFIEAD